MLRFEIPRFAVLEGEQALIHCAPNLIHLHLLPGSQEMLDLCLSAVPLRCADGVPLKFSRNGSSSVNQNESGIQQRSQPLLENLRRNIIGSNNSNHDGRDGLLAAKLQRELARSNYRLADVRCEIDSSAVHLFGIVKSYHALQMAIQIARKLVAGRRIELEVDVVPRLYEDDVEDSRALQLTRC